MNNKRINKRIALLFATITILLQGCGSKTDSSFSEYESESGTLIDVTYDENGNATYREELMISDDYELVTEDIGQHSVIKKYNYKSTIAIDVPYGYEWYAVNYGYPVVNKLSKTNSVSDVEVSIVNTFPVKLKKHECNNSKGYIYEDNLGEIIGGNESYQHIDDETGNIIFERNTHIIIIKRDAFDSEESYDIPEGYKIINPLNKVSYRVELDGDAWQINSAGTNLVLVNEVEIEIPGYYDKETGKYVYNQSDFGTPIREKVREMK